MPFPARCWASACLIPLAGFDNALDSFMREHFGISTGLLLSGSIAAIIFAYVARFLAVSFGAIESGLQKVTPNVAAAARTLGRGPLAAFFEVHLPLLRPALVSAALLVFVDCMKELPATLILRPFDFETLATTVFMLASLDQLEESALAGAHHRRGRIAAGDPAVPHAARGTVRRSGPSMKVTFGAASY